MAKILVCDRCKKPENENRPIVTYFVITGRQCDPAGSVDDVGEHVDLCPACLLTAMTSILGDFIGQRDYERNKKLLAWIKR